MLARDRRVTERRAAAGLVAHYWNGGAPEEHKIRDISSTGLYVVTKDRWYPGTLIEMAVQTADKDGDEADSCPVQSRVVRAGSDGVGFEFIFLSAAKRYRKAFDSFLRAHFTKRSSISGKKPTKLGGEDGQALILAALSLTCILGVAGFATDVGTFFHAKRMLQSAADSAAIAGALELNYGDAAAAARAAAAQNGVVNGSNGATVVVNTPPLNGPHAGNAGYVEVIATESRPTFFMKLFHFASMDVTARAVATNGPSQGCIYTLGTSGTDISIVGNANITARSCGIIDNSASNNAMELTGNISLNAQSIGVVGNYRNTGNVDVNPTPVTGIVPVSDPLAFLQPPSYGGCVNPPKMAGNGTFHLGPATPGGTICYNSLSPTGNITIDLSPGVYVINGNMQLTGNQALSGTGVTFYLLGKTSLTGNVSVDLSAPTSGSYNGMLFYQPASNTNSMSLVGNSGSRLEGVIYAPTAKVSLTGNSGSQIYTDFVVSSLSLVGNASFQDYAAVNGAGPLTAARLVE